MAALQAAVDNFERPAFPCALILGDVVILDLLHRLDLLASGRVPIIFVDTFHLFPETHQLLRKLEVRARRRPETHQAENSADALALAAHGIQTGCVCRARRAWHTHRAPRDSASRGACTT